MRIESNPSTGHATTTVSPDRDALSRFLLQASGVRGVIVRLNQTWQTVRDRADYPDAVAERLGETLAAAALFTGHIKIDGRLSVQLRGTGALRSLFAECTREGTLRGLAQYREPLPQPLNPRALGADALLAITIENRSIDSRPGDPGPLPGRDGGRYQGLVDLDADSLPEAFEDYFNRSEQLPTRIALAADHRTAAGIMLQRLPVADNADIHSIDADADGWRRASALLATLRSDELLALPVDALLHLLFHEDSLQLLDSRPLRFACSCSVERVRSMFQGLGQDEAMAAAESGQAEVICEFCGQSYRFGRAEITALFAAVEAFPAPERLQ